MTDVTQYDEHSVLPKGQLVGPASLGFVAFLILLLTIGTVSVRITRESERIAQWTDQTIEVLQALYRIRSNITDLETGKRGFLLTFDESYLNPYGSSAERTRQDLLLLRNLVTNNVSQSARAAALDLNIEARLQSIDEVVRVARTYGQQAAVDMTRNALPKHLMNQIRLQIADMIQVESRILDDRQALTAAAVDETEKLVYVATTLAAAFVAIAFTLTWREIQRRQGITGQLIAMRGIAERRATALQHSQASLLLAKQEAERANQAKGRFLAAAGHDLRQPLHLIGLAVEQLARQAGEAGSRNARRAEAGIVRLDRTFSQFGAMARLSAANSTPHRQRVNVGALIAEICEGLQPLAAKKGLRLRHVPTAFQHDTDPDMLTAILENLIGNAIKYTQDGGVLVGVRRRRQGAVIQVHDTGTGIPPENLGIIFDEFQQLGQGPRNGVGLGLSIVKRAVDLLGYRITVQSRVGHGTSFHVIMPPAKKSQKPAQSAAHAQLNV